MPELRASDCSCSPAFSGERKLPILINHLYEANARLRLGLCTVSTLEQPIERARALQYGTVSMNFISRFAGKEGAEYEPEFLYESESADVPCT